MDWEDRLDDWELELELNAQLEGSDWVTLERAAHAAPGFPVPPCAAGTGPARSTSRLAERPAQAATAGAPRHGRRAEASPRLRRTAERRLADQAQLEILRHRVDQLELRLAALEGRPPQPVPPENAAS